VDRLDLSFDLVRGMTWRRPKIVQQGLDQVVAQQRLDQTVDQQCLDQAVAQQHLDQVADQQALDQAIAPVIDVLEKTEHEIVVRDFRIKRLRSALEFHPNQRRRGNNEALCVFRA